VVTADGAQGSHVLKRPTTMTDSLVESLRVAILSGEFSPGEHLRQSTLAERYGVSRIPLRDALSRLASDGLIEFDQHRNGRVAQLDVDDIREIYMIRLALEPMAAYRAVSLVTDARAQRLAQLSETMDLFATDLVEGPRSRRDFYDAFYRESGMVRIHGVIMRMRDEMTLYHRTSASSAADGHDALRQCIRDRDPKRAEKEITLHLEQALDGQIAEIGTRASQRRPEHPEA
jgi:DNA-binding GntR family transcriptional regulator